MQPDNNFYTLLEQFEGFKPCPYLDSAHVPTIGIGSIHYCGGTPINIGDPCISHDQAVHIVDCEITSYINTVNTLVKSTITQNQFNALLSFTYNEGQGALKGSHLLQLVNQDPTNMDIKEEFIKWNKVRNPITHKLVYSEGLNNRRLKEYALYSS